MVDFHSERGFHEARRRRLITAVIIIGIAVPLQWYMNAADLRPDDVQTRSAKFQFARMRYPGGIPAYIKNWYTDYPAMEQHLTTLLGRATQVDVAPPVVVDASSPQIFNYPLIYSVEPEQMTLGPRDAANLREYLERGGIWFADDFHGDAEFNRFLQQLQRVIPNAKPVELTTAHPLFHCFYDIDRIVQVTNDAIAKCAECNQWENGPSGQEAKVFAIVNDKGRPSVLMAWNTDLGDGLEWADDPAYPAPYATYSFQFLSNLIVYATSH